MGNEFVEMVDVVDENNRVIGEAPRKGIHKTDKLHRAVHIFLIDSQGRLWIEKRGPNTDTLQGHYDCSAAGHVEKGESYEHAAQREAMEELGIEDLEFKHAFDMKASAQTLNEFLRFYVARSDKLPRLHPDAASQERYTIPEIEEKMKSGETFTPTFPDFLKWVKENVPIKDSRPKAGKVV